jgi:ribosomal protein L11 methyltransferase
MVEEYVCLELAVTSEERAIAYALLSLFPIEGVEEEEQCLCVYLRTAVWDSIKLDFQQLLSSFPGLTLRSARAVDSQDWYRTWLAQLQPIWLTDNIVVHPFPEPPRPGQYPVGCDVLHIVPGTAFGTGHHASTRLAAQLLVEFLSPDTLWIDAGTGSGILAILAARRGARYVYAVDNNPYAIEQARQNVLQNSVAERVELVLGDLHEVSLPSCDGIVANLHAELLQELAERFASCLRPGGVLVISGILQTAEPPLEASYRQAGFQVKARRHEDEWVAFALQRS